MRLRFALIPLAVVTLALCACALRPRYNELIEAGTRADDHVRVVFKDRSTGQPLPNLPISISSGPVRMTVTTDANGEASIPINAALTQDNPLVVVDLPTSSKGYVFGSPGGPTEKPGQIPTEQPNIPAGSEPGSPLSPTANTDGGFTNGI